MSSPVGAGTNLRRRRSTPDSVHRHSPVLRTASALLIWLGQQLPTQISGERVCTQAPGFTVPRFYCRGKHLLSSVSTHVVRIRTHYRSSALNSSKSHISSSHGTCHGYPLGVAQVRPPALGPETELLVISPRPYLQFSPFPHHPTHAIEFINQIISHTCKHSNINL